MRQLTPEEIRAMRALRRWHTRRSLGEAQTLLDHTAAVALLALFLAGDVTPETELCLLRLALVHDVHETVFGDVPRPAREALAKEGIDLDGVTRRRWWGGQDPYAQAPGQVLDLLEVADALDAALWAQDHVPDSADQAAREAAAEAHRRLQGGPLARALSALGIWGGQL